MYLSYTSPSLIIHTEITLLAKKSRNNKQKYYKKKLKCDRDMTIDHDVPAKRYVNKVRMSRYQA